MTIFNQESRQKQRRKQGLQIAQQAAKLLVNKYAVEKVVLFGSLLKPCPIRDHSDIDLAVWGLANQSYHSALNEVSNLTLEFSFDLVQVESASSSLQQVIQQQGKIIIANGRQLSNLDTIISLSSLKQPMNQYAILFSQIEQESQDIEKLVEKNKVLYRLSKVTGNLAPVCSEVQLRISLATFENWYYSISSEQHKMKTISEPSH
ncbi:MAG: hypothetical protein GVY04_15955 [Cyanobacteria bacterium]|jgi:predicted nucleotidyltransferase|nr:hypothetical protein [Cyanobacteria bacterium GSL.Bin1]